MAPAVAERPEVPPLGLAPVGTQRDRNLRDPSAPEVDLMIISEANSMPVQR